MIVTAIGHWKGNPAVKCGRLTAVAETQADADKLALLFRVLTDPDQRERLLDAAEGIEASAAAALDPVFA